MQNEHGGKLVDGLSAFSQPDSTVFKDALGFTRREALVPQCHLNTAALRQRPPKLCCLPRLGSLAAVHIEGMTDDNARDLPAVNKLGKKIEIFGTIIPSQRRQALSRDAQLVAERQPDPPLSKVKPENPPWRARHVVILQQRAWYSFTSLLSSHPWRCQHS